MPKTPKLKVYSTPVGFYDALIAAPSKAAALKAWGTKTDLFAAGRAALVEDPALQAAALATPGEIVKRPRGNEAEMLDFDPPAAAPAPAARPTVRKPAKPKVVAPPPDRTELDAAERAITQAERDLRDSLEEISDQRAALERRESEVRRTTERQLADLRAAKDKAEFAYRRSVRAAGRE